MTQMLNWDATKFSVGHEEIDRQHQTIIGLINQLKIDANDPYLPHIGDFTLSEILIYADNHLACEEKIMVEAGYPDLAEHKEIHNFYRAGIKDLQKKIEEGDASIKKDMVFFFNEWWEKHILEDDMKFKPYVEKL